MRLVALAGRVGELEGALHRLETQAAEQWRLLSMLAQLCLLDPMNDEWALKLGRAETRRD